MIMKLMPQIKPLDVIIYHAENFNPLHWAIGFRSFSKYVHCSIVKDNKANIFNPTIGGILNHNLFNRPKETVTVCRLRQSLNLIEVNKMLLWCEEKQKTCKGYDYLAWLGFATTCKAFTDEDRWFCSELPYWMFMENGIRLTNEEMKFPFPCEFVRNPLFETVYVGKVTNIPRTV